MRRRAEAAWPGDGTRNRGTRSSASRETSVSIPTGDDYGEAAYVYHAASPATAAPLVTLIRVRGNAGGLAARLPVIAAAVDPGLSVQQALPLNDIVQLRDMTGVVLVGALGGVTLLVLAMSAMGIFSLMSVSVSRRTREIGLRTALGANPRQVVVSVLSRAAILMASGGAGGGALLLWIVSVRGVERPAGRRHRALRALAGSDGARDARRRRACGRWARPGERSASIPPTPCETPETKGHRDAKEAAPSCSVRAHYELVAMKGKYERIVPPTSTRSRRSRAE